MTTVFNNHAVCCRLRPALGLALVLLLCTPAPTEAGAIGSFVRGMVGVKAGMLTAGEAAGPCMAACVATGPAAPICTVACTGAGGVLGHKLADAAIDSLSD